MRKLRFLIAGGLTVLLLFAPTLVAAQSPPPPSVPVGQTQAKTRGPDVVNPMQAACGRELQQYCSGIQPGGGRLIQCLTLQNDLSDRCKTLLNPMQAPADASSSNIVPEFNAEAVG
jgi:hypothetical protein